MTTLICPRCRQRLSVSELAPRRLTCPNCLAALINPRWGQAPPTPRADLSQRAFPRPILPLDHQVERDSRGGAMALGAFAAVLVGAALISFQIPGDARKVGVAMIIVALLCVVTIFLQIRYKPDEPAGQIGAAMGETLGILAGGCLKIGLIALGVLALLFGACAIMFAGSKWHGS